MAISAAVREIAPFEGPLQVGLHAIDYIFRAIYQGAYPDGMAMRFESFQMWESPARFF